MPEIELLDLYEERGGTAYTGEPVTQLEHALQTAALATAAAAPASMIIAALLHDIGHLLSPEQHATEHGIDTRHEHIGWRYLQRWFAPSVTEPVRLHVTAKRYLARRPDYTNLLSAESQRSLALQGGAMSDSEAKEFEAQPHFADAVRLRGWDDAAKIVGCAVPNLHSFRNLLEEVRIHA